MHFTEQKAACEYLFALQTCLSALRNKSVSIQLNSQKNFNKHFQWLVEVDINTANYRLIDLFTDKRKLFQEKQL